MTDSAFPRYIEFQTTSRCNARCKVCPMEWVADELPHGRMPDDLIDKILTELAEHADELVSVEPYLNNEPFMDRRFIDVLRRIRTFYPGSVEVSTNGTLLSQEYADQVLADKLIDDFRISVFGAEQETYEHVMRLRWDRMTSNVEYFARRWNELGRPVQARLVYVHNPDLQAEDEFERLRARWEPYGLDFIHWEQLDRVGNVRQSRNQVPLLRSRTGMVTGCKMGYMRDRISIHYDGSVYLCCQDWSRTVLIGNVRDSSIAEVWASEKRKQEYREIYGLTMAAANHMCRSCELATIDVVREAS